MKKTSSEANVESQKELEAKDLTLPKPVADVSPETENSIREVLTNDDDYWKRVKPYMTPITNRSLSKSIG